ncbi:MAG: hypothetical protein FH748_07615 [Balneolaceae bacterium]|nr:hypothetical protein [Balneolaceae bacterium]
MYYLRNFLVALIIAGTAVSCVQVGKIVGKLLTSSTDDLNEASTQVRFIRNTYPPETNTTEAGYFENWAEGRNAVTVNSFKRNGIGMLKIDGKVSANGETLPYVDNGAYGKFLNDLTPQKIDIETTSGQSVSFEVAPIEAVSIKSINNGTNEIDLTKDLVIELDENENTQHKNMRVMLLMKMMGARGWVDVANFKAKEKVVIPAEAFRHLPGLNPEGGDSYLLIERYKIEPNIYENIGAAQVLSLSWDAKPVTVTNKVKQSNGLKVRGEIKDKKGTISYTATKPNAFLGRPFSQGKKFALTSLTIRATKLKQSRSKTSTSTSYYSNYKVTTTTTRTETRKFPTLPDIFWDRLTNKMYKDILGTLNKNLNAEFIAVETVVEAPSYQQLQPIDDKITEVAVSQSYKGTKSLLPTTLPAIMSSISSTFASDRIDARLLRELDVDALVAVTVDLEMPWDEFSLSPRMSFRITGAPNGYIYGPTVFAEGVISGNGIELDEAKEYSVLNIDLLNEIIRQDMLIRAFDTSLKELKTQEQKQAYEKIWALQD